MAKQISRRPKVMLSSNDPTSSIETYDATRHTMGEETFLRLRDLLYRASGMYFERHARRSLERRLRPRVEALHLKDFEQYYLYLQFDRDRQDELQRALDAVAVHETFFFRERRALTAFKEEILPQIHARGARANERALRVWSAGCSTGDEAYTLAMLIAETNLFHDWQVELSASDLSQRVITEARRGLYSERSFRNMNEEEESTRAKYFTRQPNGTWLVNEVLRNAVNFGCFNLIDSRRFDVYSNLDVIFCRNVMIYFDSAARRQAVNGFHHQLRPDGYLILGASESLITLNAPFRLAHLQNDLVYQKGVGG